MSVRSEFAFVLGVYPNARGIAFVIFEGPGCLIDWGMRGARRHGHDQLVDAVARLVDQYWPPIIVLQDMSTFGTRRSERIRSLNEAIKRYAEERGVPVSCHSRTEVHAAFASVNARTKAAIAAAIAARVPALERHLPPPRKPWMSEHASMGIFDAAALALTFLSNAGFAIE